MNKIPIAELPWEIQLMFWVMSILSSVGIGVSVWFILRFIRVQDDFNQSFGKQFSDLKSETEATKKSTWDAVNLVRRDVADFRKTMVEAQLSSAKRDQEIHQELKEVSGVAKAVRAHHEVLKTLVIKINELMVFKNKS